MASIKKRYPAKEELNTSALIIVRIENDLL